MRDRDEVAGPADGGSRGIDIATKDGGHHGEGRAGAIEVHAGHFFEPFHASLPKLDQDSFPYGEAEGAGVEDGEEGLVGHEFDHSDDE
ncbi:MAG: hypothetical protein ACJAQT_001072 [Akkermansiaceae bacterium]